MLRWLVFTAVLALAGPAAPAAEGECDPDTLAGMKAEVGEKWVQAVRGFERALAAAPDDSVRQARLDAARRRGRSHWLGIAEEFLRAGHTRPAAFAAAAAREIAPDDPRLGEVLAKLEQAGEQVPEELGDLSAPPGMPLRTPRGRMRAPRAMGELGPTVEALIRGGQDYLLKIQEPGGYWDCDAHGGYPLYDVGVTGLALSALMVDGRAALNGDRGEALRKGVAWLVGRQDPEGVIASKVVDHFPYCHAIATETLAVWGAISGEMERIAGPLGAARDWIEKSQTPGAGWRYAPMGDDSDTSITFWMVSALDRLRRIRFAVYDRTWNDAAAWAKQVTVDSGRTGYTQPGTGAARPAEMLERFPGDRSESMTAAGLLILHLAGADATALERKQRSLILACPPASDVPDMYYGHLGARALLTTGRGIPEAWYSRLVSAAKDLEDADGSIRPVDPWGRDGGRVFSTAVTVLALSAPWAEGGGPSGSGVFRRLGEEALTVELRAAAGVLATGIYLDEGVTVLADPDGKVRASPGAEFEGPVGGSTPRGRDRLTRRGRYGCLLGRIGPDGKPFAIRRKGHLTIEGCGQLYLLLNEEDPSRAEGKFTLRLSLTD